MTSPGPNRETAKSREGKKEHEGKNTETVETSKVLEKRRWEVQEGPFRGFNSPPGRF